MQKIGIKIYNLQRTLKSVKYDKIIISLKHLKDEKHQITRIDYYSLKNSTSPLPKKHLFKLQLSTQKESQLRDTIVRGFTVALSRSRVVNYSRPKGIEKATSLLRCVRNPANPFSLLPLSLSLALSVSRFEHPEKKRRIRAGERRRRERGEEEAIVERIVS